MMEGQSRVGFGDLRWDFDIRRDQFGKVVSIAVIFGKGFFVIGLNQEKGLCRSCFRSQVWFERILILGCRYIYAGRVQVGNKFELWQLRQNLVFISQIREVQWSYSLTLFCRVVIDLFTFRSELGEGLNRVFGDSDFFYQNGIYFFFLDGV